MCKDACGFGYHIANGKKGRLLAQDNLNGISGDEYGGNVKIGAMYPLFKTTAGDCQYDPAGARRLQAFLLALEEINNSSDILPNTRLSYSVYDSKRDAGQSFFQAIAAQTWGADVVVGPANSGSSVNSQLLLREYDIPQISYSSTSAELSVVEQYPYFMRTCPSDAFQAVGMAELCIHYNWTSVATLYSSSAYGTAGIEAFVVAARERGIDVLSTQSFQPDADDFSTQIQATLDTEAKVIIIFCSSHAAAHLMEQGYSMGLGGSGYVFIGSDSASNIHIYDHFTEAADVPNIMRGFHGFNPFSGDGTEAHDAFIEKWLNLAPTYDETTGWCSEAKDDAGTFIWRRYDVECIDENFATYDACAGFVPDLSDVSGYVAYSYDAVYTVAYALHELIEIQGIPEEELSGAEIFSAMKNVRFNGVTGMVSFDQETGDRTEGVEYILLNSDGYKNNPIGVWNSYTGISVCPETGANAMVSVDCAFGQVWSTGENSAPRGRILTCEAGYYYAEDRDTCVACPDGFFAATTGATSCTPCPPGTFDDTPGVPSVGCSRCSPGEFNPEFNMSSSTGCHPCSPGTYQAKAMQTSCLACPASFFTQVSRSATCILCGAARYTDETGSTECISCPDHTTNWFPPTLLATVIGAYSVIDAEEHHCPFGTMQKEYPLPY
ncbi:hypothetical protein CYMTET_34834, partial [Cymbomonas tetramitiformis]